LRAVAGLKQRAGGAIVHAHVYVSLIAGQGAIDADFRLALSRIANGARGGAVGDRLIAGACRVALCDSISVALSLTDRALVGDALGHAIG
jgi:hypothetical protein